MKQSAIEIIGYNRCTGCYGCLNICPIHEAIEFKLTNEGFYKPFLTNKCIHCGKCQEGCPVIKTSNINNKEELEVYSCWSNDKEILMNSSSGGIFSELAKIYLEDNGTVFGAKWEDGEIVHSHITTLESLNELQKSKYLQSKIELSYIKVKDFLKVGKKVLFVGTP
ncbi:MAG: 4Fe-4S dicluster domain-containing protein, partial [Fusobacterium varium]|nr:4Fe-4S dicluster domain-containing protein [Fusobacterium varium]